MEMDLFTRAYQADKKFKAAQQQVLILDRCMEDLQVRYDRAAAENRRSYRYSLRLKICSVEGVRNMFCEYAMRQYDLLEELRIKIRQFAGNTPMEASDTDNSDSDSDGWDDASDLSEEETMPSPPRVVQTRARTRAFQHKH